MPRLYCVLLAIITAVLGYFIAILLPQRFGFNDTTAGGVMAALSGLLFVLVVAGKWTIVRLANRSKRLPQGA